MKIKEKLNAIAKVLKLNTSKHYCQVCLSKAKFFSMYDIYYKKYKFYLKCPKCLKTTPAYENIEEALVNWYS